MCKPCGSSYHGEYNICPCHFLGHLPHYYIHGSSTPKGTTGAKSHALPLITSIIICLHDTEHSTDTRICSSSCFLMYDYTAMKSSFKHRWIVPTDMKSAKFWLVDLVFSNFFFWIVNFVFNYLCTIAFTQSCMHAQSPLSHLTWALSFYR